MKRIIIVLIFLIQGCGSGGSSSDRTNDDSPEREIEANLLNGTWTLGCQIADELLTENVLGGDGLWVVEVLRISEDSFTFDWRIYSDSSCQTISPFDSLFDVTNQGGELLSKSTKSSRYGYVFNRYTVGFQRYNGDPISFDLYYANSAMYKVDFDFNEFLGNGDVNDPQNYIVNFNKIYVRE